MPDIGDDDAHRLTGADLLPFIGVKIDSGKREHLATMAHLPQTLRPLLQRAM
jgi:hypothetical protein